MPSYKNQLTHYLIASAFKQNKITQSQQIEVEYLYDLLSDFSRRNQIAPSKIQSTFNRQIFNQLVQQCPLTNGKLKLETFIYNVMRAEILINQKLTQIHYSIQIVEARINGQQLNESHISEVNSKIKNATINGKFDLNNLAQELFELKQLKAEFDQDLYILRLVFIKEEQLRNLTKKLSSSRSNNNLKPIDNTLPMKISQRSMHKSNLMQTSIVKAPIIGRGEPNQQIFIPPYQNEEQRQREFPITMSKVQNTKRNLNLSTPLNFKLILILTFGLSILELPILIVYNHFLNVIVFGVIMTMFVVEYYNKVMIQFFLGITLWSMVVDIVWFFVNGQFFVKQSAFSGITGVGIGTQIRHLNGFFYFILALILVIFIGKIVLSMLFLMQLQIHQSNDIQINIFGCINLCLKPLALQQEGIIHSSLSRAVVNNNVSEEHQMKL